MKNKTDISENNERLAFEPVLYDRLLLEGESFWQHHNRLTLFEIQDAINVMKISGRLPDCMWEDLQHIHATNYGTFYNLTKRMIDADYPGVFTKIKPNRDFLQWIYEGVKAAAGKANVI